MANLLIRKRNGVDVNFDKTKIVHAIERANRSVSKADTIDSETIEKIASKIEEYYLKSMSLPTVESVQDMVIREIQEAGKFSLANNYIIYRYQHELQRKSNSTDAAVFGIVECNSSAVKEENSNKNTDIIPTQRDYIAGEVSKDMSRRFLLPLDIMTAHDDGLIHFHDMDYFIQHSHNCFGSSTRFVTDRGLRMFRDFKDGEEVVVKDKNGDFRKATVRKYGKQRMQVVELKNGKMTHNIICTPNHRWILEDGTITTSLKTGDKLLRTKNSTSYDIQTKEDAEAFCIGFIIGDGCDHNSKISNGYVQVRLCGYKCSYVSIFEKAGYTIYPISNSTDLLATRKGAFKQDFLNAKAWRFMSLNAKVSLFHGFYCADGSNSSNRLSTGDDRVAEMIRDTSALAGYYISSAKEKIHDTPYKNGARIINFHFIIHQPINSVWTVKSICNYHGNEEFEAWCVEEPVTQSFTLEKGIVTGNCCLVNMDDMLQNGTVISSTLIEKPHRFSTACNIGTQIIAQMASIQYGGQSVSIAHLAKFVNDSRLAIRKEIMEENSLNEIEMTDDQINKIVSRRLRNEVKAGIQTIQYQVLTLMTTNGQTPFITLFMDLNEAGDDDQLRDDIALCIEEVLLQRIEGVKNEVGEWITPAFPKLVFMLDEDNVYPGSKYFYLVELCARCNAKRISPDYISAKIERELKGDLYTCMGCRSFLTPDRFTDKGIGNIANAKNYEEGKHKYYGRFNQGVVTINLPYVAMQSSGDMEEFWKIFEEDLELCHRALRIRHEHLLGTSSDVAPIAWQYGGLARLEKGEVIDKLLYNGYSTISLGYAGLFECTKYMTGFSHTEEGGKSFALAVMKKMNEKTAEWKAAENIDYSLYGTPLESTTYKFAKALKAKFGVVKDVSDHNYITNSYHVNVREEIDAFKKLEFEAEFQAMSPGGAISYVEVPNMNDNIPAVISVIQYIYEHIMYAELNTKSDYCQVCGYDGEIKIIREGGKLLWECPKCGNRDQHKMNVARRTCGYIGTQFWNQGRTEEIADRVLHL